MSSIEDLKCLHGHIVACKECNQALYDAMYKAGQELARKQEQRIIDILLNNKRL